MDIQPDKQYLRVAVTDRHAQSMPAEHYLLTTLPYRTDAYQAAYDAVMEWHDWNMFAGFDGVLLYICSRIEANFGAADALDALKIPYALMAYEPGRGTYRKVERKVGVR